MSQSKPVMALGLDIYNPTLSIMGAAPGIAAGWGLSGGPAVGSSSYSGPKPGHHRVQRIAIPNTSGVATLVSNWVRGRTTNPATTLFCGLLHARHTGIASDTRIYIQWGDSSGAAIGQLQLGTAITATTGDDWELFTKISSGAPTASAVYARVYLRLAPPASGTSYWSFAFAGVGCYNDASAYYQWTRYYAHPGTAAWLAPRRNASGDSMGRLRFVDAERCSHPFRLDLATSGIPEADKEVLEWFHRYNCGSVSEGTAKNPSGGYWPILIAPGTSVAPAAMLADFVDAEFTLRPAGRFLSDPAIYTGPVRFLERV